MSNLEFIQNFSKISIAGICRKLKIDRSNLITGRTSEENIKMVRKYIESELAKLYLIKEVEQNEENETKEMDTKSIIN
jgi:hypothetical protein